MPLDDVLGPDAAFPASGVGRPVLVEGRWDPGHTVYVADRPRGGQNGVWVVTPVIDRQPARRSQSFVAGTDSPQDTGCADGPRRTGRAAAAVGGHRRPGRRHPRRRDPRAEHDRPPAAQRRTTSTAGTSSPPTAPSRGSTGLDRHGRSGRGHAEHLPGRRRVDRAAQPALRLPVVGVRRVRDLHVVALAAGGRARAGGHPGRRVGSSRACRSSSSRTGCWPCSWASCSPSARWWCCRPLPRPDGSACSSSGETWSILGSPTAGSSSSTSWSRSCCGGRPAGRLPFALLVLVSGLIPLVIFCVERVVTRRIRAEHPELAPGYPGIAQSGLRRDVGLPDNDP